MKMKQIASSTQTERLTVAYSSTKNYFVVKSQLEVLRIASNSLWIALHGLLCFIEGGIDRRVRSEE